MLGPRYAVLIRSPGDDGIVGALREEMALNEGTFQFAALRELSNSLLSTHGRAPIIPTQRRERHDPWDASIEYAPGKVLLLQFKAAKCRHRLSKKDTHGLTPVFFEFGVRWQPSDQHNKIRRLAFSGYEIYYVAPMFDQIDELDRLYMQGKIMDRSIAVDPKRLPEIKEDGHKFCYKEDGHGVFCSEPIDVDITPLRTALDAFSSGEPTMAIGQLVSDMQFAVKDALGLRGITHRLGDFSYTFRLVAAMLRLVRVEMLVQVYPG